MEHPSPTDGAVCEGTGSHVLFLRLVSIRAPKAAAALGHLRGEQCPSLGLGEKTLNLKPWREMPRVCTWCLRHPCQGAWLGHGCCFVGILSKQLSEALHFGVFLTQIDPLQKGTGLEAACALLLGVWAASHRHPKPSQQGEPPLPLLRPHVPNAATPQPKEENRSGKRKKR